MQTGLRYRERLAGILALSTYLPLAGSLEQEATAANRAISIFMAHGDSDPLIPMDRASTSRDTLEKNGYGVEWQEYPMQHSVCPEELHDVGGWLRKVLA